MRRESSINWIESKNKVLIKTPWNEVMKKKLYDQGFAWDRSLGKYTKTIHDEDLPFLLSLGEGFKKEPGYQALLKSKAGLLRALRCHHDKSGDQVEVPMLKRELMPSQKVLLEFIRANQGRCIAGDEQGAGKTYPPLVYCYEEKVPTLILCPQNLVENWKREIQALFFEDDLMGSLFRVVGFDSHKEIDELANWAQAVIVDEAHHLSDLKSKRHLKVHSLSKKIEKLILITGNSIKYWPVDFYSMLKLLGKDLTKERYLKRFFHYTFENNRLTPIALKSSKLKYFIAPFYLRRELSEIKKDLKGENSLFFVKLSPQERQMYDSALKSRGVILSGSAIVNINKTLSLLKLPHLVKYLKQVFREDPKKKLVICSQFKELFDGLRTEFNFCTSYPEKSQLVFLDTSTFREGFSLGEYDTFIMMDVFASKCHNIQIKRRFLRVGQEADTVTCTYFLAGLLDQELLKMPEILNYQKSIEYIDRYLRSFEAA